MVHESRHSRTMQYNMARKLPLGIFLLRHLEIDKSFGSVVPYLMSVLYIGEDLSATFA